MPTGGSWLWKDVNQAKIAARVFAHRADLWAMFYGEPGAEGQAADRRRILTRAGAQPLEMTSRTVPIGLGRCC